MKYSLILLIGLVFFAVACEGPEEKPSLIPVPGKTMNTSQFAELDSTEYYDKVLGALVGSAIGDAMGASTEMWSREDIQREYGYINELVLVDRTKSPEGIWQHQMDTGATTDDTRWKFLMGKYFAKYREEISVDHFAEFIIDYYQSEAEGLADEAILSKPDLLDDKMQRIDWIKEWARVAIAYRKGGPAYYQVQNRFYGGEMSCAGILYTPMFGLVTASPTEAYETGFEHGMFDIGYARDISGIVAAMTQYAMRSDSMSDIMQSSLLIDPYGYMDSRLIGRLAYMTAEDSKEILKASLELPLEDTIVLELPKHYRGTKSDWIQQEYIYSELEIRQQAIAFHAGEIWQILYTGLLFGKGNFEKTMTFIVNYGRDNDTVAAAAGTILGAKLGYSGLPVDLRERILTVSRELMGLDLELIAKEIVASQQNASPKNKSK